MVLRAVLFFNISDLDRKVYKNEARRTFNVHIKDVTLASLGDCPIIASVSIVETSVSGTGSENKNKCIKLTFFKMLQYI